VTCECWSFDDSDNDDTFTFKISFITRYTYLSPVRPVSYLAFIGKLHAAILSITHHILRIVWSGIGIMSTLTEKRLKCAYRSSH
jgi:hypothetical protein